MTESKHLESSELWYFVALAFCGGLAIGILVGLALSVSTL